MQSALVWLILARAPGVGRGRLARLMAAYPDPADAWQLSPSELAKVEGWGPAPAESAHRTRKNPEVRRAAELELEAAWKAGLRLIAMPDMGYPVRLRYISDPPPYLYQAGPWEPDARPVVAVVGTRNPTPYGYSVAYRFGHDLARNGVVVVSGMARGIDCAAHRGALEAGGTTIAVLGGGADQCYPREAAPIYQQIRDTGAVLSEQPPGAEPRREHFPERNRIISGLADGVLMVEAGEKSGTIITVKAALDQGRDVFAVPGPITSPMSAGVHREIRQGARLVTSVADILEDLGVTQAHVPTESRLPSGLSREEERLLRWMGLEPRWAGDLSEAIGLAAAEVQSVLTMLELKGLARRLPGGQYVRTG